jgi:O-6-methylguanine DNA methyltransferase
MTNPTTADVVAGLESLRTIAPSSIIARTLVETGLADQYAAITAPTGVTLYVAFNQRGVSAVVPASDEATFLAIYEARVGNRAFRGALPPRLASGIQRTLRSGKLGALPVDLTHLSEFQQAVLRKTAEIPPGELRTYGWVAREIDKPGAVRAVGSALNKNPVPVVIPCHRVGRSDGSVGDYAYGEEMKRELLEHEGLDTDAVDAVVDAGIRFYGSDTTNVFCFPTCRHAKRITDQHLVAFRSQRQAESAGYRPCKVCRPVAA